MNKCLIYEDANGYCRIIVPGEKFKQDWESEENAIARLHNVAIPSVVEFIVCSPEALPDDLTFRCCWKKGDITNPVRIDLDKALEVHRDRLKQAADRKIEILNKELELAEENDNLPQQVAIKRTKKILRTIHEANLTHCKTAEDIKYSIPKELHDVWTLYKPIKE